MHLTRLVGIACCVVVPSIALSQVGARAVMPSSPRISRPASSGLAAHGSLVGFGHPGFHHPNRFGSVYLGSPLWWDDGYDYGSPQIVVARPEQTGAAPQPSMHWEDVPKAQPPLLIELQGDRYVRVSGSPAADTPSAYIEPHAADQASSSTTAALSRPAEESSTVFIFRDGHREESSNYSIVAGTIYASTDYWSNGAWTRKIPVADLNIPATLQANQERGVRFVLPSAPNEVVTRP